MSILDSLRTLGIYGIFGVTLVVLGKTLLTRETIEPTPLPVEFPTAAPLAGWERLKEEADPTAPNTARYRHLSGPPGVDLEMQFIPDLPTHYIRNPLIDLRFLPRGHLPLDAKMHYYVDSRGKVLTNLVNGSPIDATVDSAKSSSLANYGIWAADQRLHLSTMITPAGESSMQMQQVARSLYVDHMSMSLIRQWLLGRAILPDRRCVLIHFSMPETSANQGEGTRILEDAWAEWQRAFRPVFPK